MIGGGAQDGRDVACAVRGVVVPDADVESGRVGPVVGVVPAVELQDVVGEEGGGGADGTAVVAVGGEQVGAGLAVDGVSDGAQGAGGWSRRARGGVVGVLAPAVTVQVVSGGTQGVGR